MVLNWAHVGAFLVNVFGEPLWYLTGFLVAFLAVAALCVRFYTALRGKS